MFRDKSEYKSGYNYEIINENNNLPPIFEEFALSNFNYKIIINKSLNQSRMRYENYEETYYSSDLPSIFEFIKVKYGLTELPTMFPIFVCDERNQEFIINVVERSDNFEEFSKFRVAYVEFDTRSLFRTIRYQVPLIIGIDVIYPGIYYYFNIGSLFTKRISDFNVDSGASLETYLEDAKIVLQRKEKTIMGGFTLNMCYYHLVDRSLDDILVKSAGKK